MGQTANAAAMKAPSGVPAPSLPLLLLNLPPLVEVERRECQVHGDCDCQAQAAPHSDQNCK